MTSHKAVQLQPDSVPSLRCSLIAVNALEGEAWSSSVQDAMEGVVEPLVRVVGPRFSSAACASLGDLVVLDSRTPDLGVWLSRIQRSGRALILAIPEGAELPEVYCEGLVDGMISLPFRKLDLQGLVRVLQNVRAWAEVQAVTAETSALLQKFREDLELSERIQRGHWPVRFPEVRGFKIRNRYLAGLKSGGDHLEVAESKEGGQLVILMSDASSYGLSSAVLGSIARVTAKLSAEEIRSPSETVAAMMGELVSALKPKDRLSLFYGVVNRKDYSFRYVNLGSNGVLLRRNDEGPYVRLERSGEEIRPSTGEREWRIGEVHLKPKDRLVFMSDGFQELFPEGVEAWLSARGSQEAEALLSDLCYSAKSRLEGQDALPEQDCTAAFFDVDSKVLRLA